MTSKRTAAIWADGSWISVPFYKIAKGSVFRLFDPDGKEVRDIHDRYYWMATSNAYVSEEFETWIIDTDEAEELK